MTIMNSIKNLQRQKDKVGNARVLCGKQKCASINKILTQKKKIFETEKHLKCPEKLSLQKYYDCIDIFYTDKNKIVEEYNLYVDKFHKCRNKMCKKFSKKMKNITNKQDKLIQQKKLLNTINNKTKNNNTNKTKNNIISKTMKGGMKVKQLKKLLN